MEETMPTEVSDACEAPEMVGVRRTGKCVRCGKCCSQVVFNLPYDPGLDEYLNWLLAHRGMRVNVDKAARVVDVIMPTKCRYLKFRGGKATCSAYARRPAICRSFPSSPLSAANCPGFDFVPVEGSDLAQAPDNGEDSLQ